MCDHTEFLEHIHDVNLPFLVDEKFVLRSCTAEVSDLCAVHNKWHKSIVVVNEALESSLEAALKRIVEIASLAWGCDDIEIGWISDPCRDKSKLAVRSLNRKRCYTMNMQKGKLERFLAHLVVEAGKRGIDLKSIEVTEYVESSISEKLAKLKLKKARKDSGGEAII